MNLRQSGSTHFHSNVVAGAHDANANAIALTGAVTADNPEVAVVGDDTNASLELTAKGTGVVRMTNGGFSFNSTVTTINTTSAVTLTIAQLKGGIIARDPNGTGRSDLWPLATDVVAACPGYAAGDTFTFSIINTADANETITMTANTGTTVIGTQTILQNCSKTFALRIASASACVVYSLDA